MSLSTLLGTRHNAPTELQVTLPLTAELRCIIASYCVTLHIRFERPFPHGVWGLQRWPIRVFCSHGTVRHLLTDRALLKQPSHCAWLTCDPSVVTTCSGTQKRLCSTPCAQQLTADFWQTPPLQNETSCTCSFPLSTPGTTLCLDPCAAVTGRKAHARAGII